ncbi:hypothetical protein GF340_01445 [Candidatus Peregrinibacteria bacterium]|nr:hypothetical protein [Candidatus Peregrinibacteria bacterium]
MTWHRMFAGIFKRIKMVNKLNKLQLDDFDALFEAAAALGVDAQSLAEIIDLIDCTQVRGSERKKIDTQKTELESLFETYKLGKLDNEFKANLEYAISLVPRIAEVIKSSDNNEMLAVRDEIKKELEVVSPTMQIGK